MNGKDKDIKFVSISMKVTSNSSYLFFTMAIPSSGFIPPIIKGRKLAVAIGTCYWFFLGYRIYHDGPHHFVIPILT
jgi:hypothetical protein